MKSRVNNADEQIPRGSGRDAREDIDTISIIILRTRVIRPYPENSVRSVIRPALTAPVADGQISPI